MSDSLGNHVGRGVGACNARLFPFPIAPLNRITRDFVRAKIKTRFLVRGRLKQKDNEKSANQMKRDIEKGKRQPRSSPEIPRPGTEQLRV